jgi:hypothetical protein
MSVGFIIMQIGNAELDKVCADVFVRALGACGLEPKRVDKHNEGKLLKSEIVRFIEEADIIIADLTNERPNCYLEIGYAMGLGKFRNLILTAREDHLPDSPNYRSGGPKIHFDLGGYDILFWHPDNLAEFRDELEKRIKRRLAILASPAGRQSEDTSEWFTQNRVRAIERLLSTKLNGYMEIQLSPLNPLQPHTPEELLTAVRSAEIQAFGWPIGIVLDRPEYKPKPVAQGIVTEVRIDEGGIVGPSFDYWTLRRDGSFYLLQSLFEDRRTTGAIFFDTRITRVTEAVLFCRRLYDRLGADPDSWVRMTVKHGGLKGRELRAADPSRHLIENPTSAENEIDQTRSFRLSEVEPNLVRLVEGFVGPLFELFDFCRFDEKVVTSVVDAFVERMRGAAGRVV